MHVCLATSRNMHMQISVQTGTDPGYLLRGRSKYRGGSLDLEAQPPDYMHGVYTKIINNNPYS